MQQNLMFLVQSFEDFAMKDSSLGELCGSGSLDSIVMEETIRLTFLTKALYFLVP
jgi:hypothetical protein